MRRDRPSPGGPCWSERLPQVERVLAVCAHPDDESFGLGAVLAAFRAAGAQTALLCFTHGEASTLGAADDLAALRTRELAAAADVLGVGPVALLDYPDGRLATVPLEELAAQVRRVATTTAADLILVFDAGGITGHPDHGRATEAALTAARQDSRAVLAWALPQGVAAQLTAECGLPFVGRAADDLDLAVTVERTVQRAAIACHVSQATSNTVLWRRLELLGEREWLRFLRDNVPVGHAYCSQGAARNGAWWRSPRPHAPSVQVPSGDGLSAPPTAAPGLARMTAERP